MSDLDLSGYSLDDLKALQKKVTKAIETYGDRQRREALAVLEEKAREMGFTIAELTGGKTIRSQGVPRYCHPNDPSVTWTGKGRQPNWIKEGLAAGKGLDDFLIARKIGHAVLNS